MGGKHGPIEIGKYLEIHESAMRGLEAKHYVVGHDLKIEPAQRGLLMQGSIDCQGGITIAVTKVLGILSGIGAAARVQTTAYTYHVQLQGFGPLLRYCGPHDDKAHPDHKPFHHKHTYDVLAGDSEGTFTRRSFCSSSLALTCLSSFDARLRLRFTRSCAMANYELWDGTAATWTSSMARSA
jgi:hypothetical protein